MPLLRRRKDFNLDLEEVRTIIDEIVKRAAARHHRLSTIYTEDFQHDREVEGVRFLNPFFG